MKRLQAFTACSRSRFKLERSIVVKDSKFKNSPNSRLDEVEEKDHPMFRMRSNHYYMGVF